MTQNATRPRPSPTPRLEKDDEPETPEISVGTAFRRIGHALVPRAGIRTIAVIVLIVALAAVAGYFGWQYFDRVNVAKAQASALTAARTYASDLSTYDYRALDRNFTKVTANSTGDFAQQYKKVSQNLTKLIQQYHATSKGTVVRAGVSEGTPNRVVVVLFVDQTITNTNSPQARVDRNRMQMVLVTSNGRWLISDVALI
jgi:Mce-associated membrane protein